MNPRPHPAYALALATALVGAAPLPSAAEEPEEPPAEHCYAWALTAEEVEAGAFTEIECYPIGEAPAARRLSVDLATIYNGANASGASPTPVTLVGASCTGALANFPAGHAWNDLISSTELIACGNAKHWTGNNRTGSNQALVGTGLHNMNATLNNATSSIEYAP